MIADRLTALVRSLPATVPFVGPETQERQRGRIFRARIGANENGFGPSPLAVAAMAESAASAWRYGDPENYDLKGALADHLGVTPANVAVGEGIDGLLGLTVRLMVEPGDAVVSSLGAYPTFNFHVAGFGGRLVALPYRDDREDIERLPEAAAREDAKLLYVANPDNPMGTWWSADAIERLIRAVPPCTVLCLDEAYGEFAPDGTLAPIDVTVPNLLRFRTFSKAYGLAGARIAYVVGEASLIAAFDKVRNHFGVNRLAQAAALAALADRDHLAFVRGAVAAARERIAGIAAAQGLAALPSATNFVAIDCGRDGAFARAVLKGLIARDVFVRMPGVAPLDRCIRVGCGPAAELDVFEAEFPAALAEARA